MAGSALCGLCESLPVAPATAELLRYVVRVGDDDDDGASKKKVRCLIILSIYSSLFLLEQVLAK